MFTSLTMQKSAVSSAAAAAAAAAAVVDDDNERGDRVKSEWRRIGLRQATVRLPACIAASMAAVGARS